MAHMCAGFAYSPPTGRRIERDVAMVIQVVTEVMNDHDTPIKAGWTVMGEVAVSMSDLTGVIVGQAETYLYKTRVAWQADSSSKSSLFP